MAETTNISWSDMTWSPWYGCTQVSMGPQGACEGCYARFMWETRFGRVQFGGPGRGEGTRDVRADSAWREPLKWDRAAAALWDYHRANAADGCPAPNPTFVFPSHCDPFDNHPALAAPRRRFFDLIRATPNLTWLLLTKRPGNIVKLFRETDPVDHMAEVWPRNAAIGCTVVSQEEADRDVPKLLAAKAALKPAFAFLSMEPLLGPVDLTALRDPAHFPELIRKDVLRGQEHHEDDNDQWVRMPAVDWVITGGETDQGKHRARETPDGAFESLMAQCEAAGVPFHLKQMTKKRPIPPHLQRQERPTVHG